MSVAMEEFFLRFLPNEYDLVVYDDEDPRRRRISDWILYLDVEEHRFRIGITKQATIGDVHSVEIALYPQGPEAQAQDKARP